MAADAEKAKQTDIRYISASYKPVAECVTEDCGWTYSETTYASVKTAPTAKRHIMANPTHVVRVTQRNVSEYAIPDQVLLDKGYELPPEVPSG